MMEFVQGGEMFSHLRKQEKFDEDVAKFYTVEIAVALNKLHSLHIAYRDLKPENICIGMKCTLPTTHLSMFQHYGLMISQMSYSIWYIQCI